MVEEHAEREEIGTRIGAQAAHLLGRNIGAGPHRQAEFFREQVGQLLVTRQAEVDQRGLAGRTQDDVGRLDVEMDDVLTMQRIERCGDARAEIADALDRQWRGLEFRQERNALDIFHHQVWLAREIADRHATRSMRPRELRQDHLLHLEADNRCRVVAVEDERRLEDNGKIDVVARHAPQRGHAADMQLFAHEEAVDERTGLQDIATHGQRPTNSRAERMAGRPAFLIFCAARSMS